ncbi:uncharacterized protein UTRI_03088_B [Ustilago trichophora]|uniref:Zn(2)-C6 fungal-type domain-containing protein n=1 Tax=Ustilago trichophora TaxID=86804 RepID=A0A5C3E5Y9_9BASI|nr:uncharacterized protein UTRI_03088_B [Ustilago trichophora]
MSTATAPFDASPASSARSPSTPSVINSATAATSNHRTLDPSPAASNSAGGGGTSPSQQRRVSTTSTSTPTSSSNRDDARESAAGSLRTAEASSSSNTTAPVPLAGKRSRSGCLTCRKRKKKCDETLCEETGGCWRCRNAGYQCEGFRRPPVVFEPGTTSTSKNKRTKRSPGGEGISNINGGGIKTEADTVGNINPLADAQSAALGHTSFTSVGTSVAAHPTIDQESLDMANSLAEFAGLATSSAGWNVLGTVPNGSANNGASKDDRSVSSISYKNGASNNASPSSFPPFLHSNAMLPPPSSHSASRSVPQPPPQDQVHTSSSISIHTPLVPCEIVGDCLFSGHHLCASCSAVANRLMQPDPAQLAALDADLVQVQPMPSLSTPMGSRHHSPAPNGESDSTASYQANAKSRLVMESLIGYYSTLITCWTQGCDVRGLEASTLFRQLVPYLLDSVDRHPPLRLSIAAVTAGYVGGARLTWPKDVVAIHQWANTLRADRTSISDCVKANLSFAFPGTPDTIWSASPGGSLSSEPHTAVSALSPANAERLRRSTTTHATLDDLLIGQAQTLKHLAVRSLEQAVSDYRTKTTRALGVSFTEKGFLTECTQINPLLLAAVNIAIYAFAEEGMESYFEEAARMRSLIDTLLGSFPPVNMAKLVSHEHLGFRTYVWADVSTAIACGTRPHLQLALSTYTSDSDDISSLHPSSETGSNGLPDLTFSMHNALLIAMSDTARLRYEFDGGDYSATARRSAGTPVPQWVHERARRIQTRVEACKIDDPLTTGSAICALMTKSAIVIMIHTFIYRVGALHPVVRKLLAGMLQLWKSAGEQYCRSVGCSNFNLPIFIASSVALDEEDRKTCAEAMQIVGHEEAGPASGRALIREVWRRTDITGTPTFWTDLVAAGDAAVAFF